uniref:Slc43a-3 n=1 Tax=Schmidtea mediterranea TaxID=79327 RepID=A0A0H3YFC8_SCHMD|nr:slc43a-3 [Schmidtea mediterranea]
MLGIINMMAFVWAKELKIRFLALVITIKNFILILYIPQMWHGKMVPNFNFKYLTLFFGWVEMVCFSGVMYGLNSLFETLAKENLFVQLCNSSSGQINESSNETLFCSTQNTYFSYIMITMMTSQCVLALPIGYLFDKFGSRISKLFVSIVFLVACILFAISFKVTSYFVFPAAFLFGISSQTLLFCNLALGKIFPKHQNLIVSVFSGSFDTSSVMLTFFTLTFLLGVGLMTSFITLGIFGFCIMLINGIFLMAKANVQNNANQRLNNGERAENLLIQEETKDLEDGVIEDKELDLMNKLEALTNRMYPDLRSIVFSKYYLFQLGSFTILYFRFTFFLIQLNLQLHYNFPQQRGLVNNLLSRTNYFFLCGILISPIAGIIVDLSKKSFLKKLPNSINEVLLYKRTMKSFVTSQLICCVCNLIVSITVIIPNVALVHVTYLCVTITRAFLFSLNSAYLLQAFPGRFFGQIMGIIVLVAGLMSFIQYAILFNDLYRLNIINFILIGFSCLNFIHPLYLILIK